MERSLTYVLLHYHHSSATLLLSSFPLDTSLLSRQQSRLSSPDLPCCCSIIRGKRRRWQGKYATGFALAVSGSVSVVDYLTCSTVSSLWAFCPGVQAGLLWSCAPHSGPAGVVLQVLGKRPSLHTPVSSVASYFLSPPAVTLHRVGSTASFVTGALPFLMLLLIRFSSTCGLKNVR